MPENTDMATPIDSTVQSAWLAVPLGYLKLTGSLLGIQEIVFKDQLPHGVTTRPPDALYRPLRQALQQLDNYFSGRQKKFDFSISLDGTPFQLQVWEELMNIPFGETISYSKLSLRLGNKNLVRAVGSANGKNPIAIAIPCHRIIGNDGSLTGYAGGLWRKEWLLKHEAQLSGKPIQLSLF